MVDSANYQAVVTGDVSHGGVPFGHVAGLILTGGASRRMGRDKTAMRYEGRTLAQRTADLLGLVVTYALEVGPGRSGLDSVVEEPAGQGPLSAIVAGDRALRRRGHEGSVVVVASALPLLTETFLRFLVAYDAKSTVLPVVDGRVQPLCAKWGRADLDAASQLLAGGERSLRFLATAPDVVLLDASQWSSHATPERFNDVDTPEDARRLGVRG